MNKQLPEEVAKTHEKSLQLLDESQVQLERFREMLRKAVVRLSIAARCEDEHLNTVLEQIKSTVKNDIDLQQLDSQLDTLFQQIDKDTGDNTPAEDAFRTDGVDHEDVISFVENVRGILELGSAVPEESNVTAILDELHHEIAGYVDHGKTDVTNEPAAPASDNHETVTGINKVLTELLDRLNLPENTSQDHQDICRQLDADLEGSPQWKTVVENMVDLINKSIHGLQDEKRELQSFIKKFTGQLADIEKYVFESRQERIDTANESSKLKDSVDNNVEAIQKSVGSTDDIARLKDNLQGYLTEIRKSVEEHQLAEVEREEMSKQGYAHIISELTRTQKETLMLKEQLQESQRRMLRDPLTGLPNRLAYEERIKLEVNRFRRNKAPLCLAMWDIDHFKKVNDTYGHDAGDRVLKLLAKIITTRVRKVDMFARIGGEEFVLLMPETGIEDALTLNNQLRTSLEDSGFHYQGSPCPITASVGIALLTEYDAHEQLLNKADKALYQSKRKGRNRCTIYEHSG